MRNKLQSGHELYFVIQEEHRGHHAKKASVSIDVIERMIMKSQFKMDKVIIELSSKLAYTEILLHMGPGDVYPISRFPRSLLQDEDSKESECLCSIHMCCIVADVHHYICRNSSERRHKF